MPVIGDTPKTPPVQKPVPVQVTAPEYKGVTVDTRYDPIKSLLVHIEGASWTVNYYSQVLGVDNALSGQNLNRPAAYQQYKMIDSLELKVTTPLTSSQDTQTKEFKVSGQAQVYPGTVIPNEGDHFITDIADGREALFIITESERRSIYKDAAFVISYELVDYAEKDARLDDLTKKTIEKLHYRRDFLLNGQNPLITSNDQHQIGLLEGYLKELTAYYFTRFFSREYSTLLVPGQGYPIYDPYLTRTMLAMFRDDLHPNIRSIRELNVDEDDNYTMPNIWSALMHRRRRDMIGCMKKVGLVAARQFSPDPKMNSLRFSGVAYAVYPADPDKTEDYLRKDYTKSLAPFNLQMTEARFIDLFDLLSVNELNGINYPGEGEAVKQVKAVNPITNDSYVFSMAFYREEAEGQSAIELLLQQYLNGDALHLPALTRLSGSYTSWGMLEQFYQLPFVMAMIRTAIRRM